MVTFEIWIALFIDLLTILLASSFLVGRVKIRCSHPATIYFVYHLYVTTYRLVMLLLGASTLFADWPGHYQPVTGWEILRGTVMTDVALLAMTAGWYQANHDDGRRRGRGAARVPTQMTLSSNHIGWCVIFFLPLGLAGMLSLTRIPGLSNSADLGLESWSSWFLIVQSWPGICLLALLYWYGFRWWLTAPMLLYLLVMAYQGYHRFRVVIPLVFLLQVYLDRQRRPWPSARLAAVAATCLLLFYPLKYIGRMAQDGLSTSEIFEQSVDVLNTVVLGKNEDMVFLDIFSATVTLVDEHGAHYYGKTFLGMLVNPIPRTLWPEKPGLADYLGDISTPSRPFKTLGAAVTYLGEAYANFGYFGIVLIPYLVAYGLGRAYSFAYSSNYYSTARFAYLLIACNLIQVFRDGLVSLAIFTVVNMMPLVAILLLHYVHPVRENVSNLGEKGQFPPNRYARSALNYGSTGSKLDNGN